MAANGGTDVLANAFYQIEIDGVTIAKFQEVAGLSAEIQVIEHTENRKGGIAEVRKTPGARKWGDITFKRGQTNDKALWTWHKEVQDGKITSARRNASIVLYDYAHGEQIRFNIFNAWPSKIKAPDMKAGGSDIAVEEVTLTHEGLELA
jgi:phage tail-like protein